ncbi:rhodanese [Natrialba hulunbeirensis JCM 10989]|uniref:Rhodanese n=1 Tax=Natrialba hulunbeirensis JCM 10989 TaxID=1227493 RepID=L9ZX31_9EURY|nr:rhodanese-like domain-containing protein [Natrialba hulunbeirensis]ELY90616.1 rhodanese [Natrialba hulunbeirensis JCM 10989]
MKRRTLLRATGGAVLGGSVGLAGCLDQFSDSESGDTDSHDFPADYETETFDGQTVPFAPLEDVAEWWENDEARFVDARTQVQYDEAHIEGAVFSPSPDGLESADPVAEWDTDTRIVTYCVCPIAQAGQRAATLLDNGYTDVYGLADGFNPWRENGYPVESNDGQASLSTYEIEGETDPADAGEYALAVHPETGQREASRIDADGGYELSLHFVDVPDSSLLELRTPSYELEGTIEEFSSATVQV